MIYGAETILTSMSIGTHDLVLFLALSDIWKYRLLTTPSYFYGCHERSQPLSVSRHVLSVYDNDQTDVFMF